MWVVWTGLWAQIILRPIYLPVSYSGDTLYNAWVGGWNSPQFSTIDIDRDGQIELFVFERLDDRGMLFKHIGGRWVYVPYADTLFPRRLLSGWVLLRDYDGDGDKDIFTNINSNVRVIRNIAPPYWQVAYDTLRSEYSPGFSSYLYASRIDIPAITDIDGDGDIDMLVYEVLGTLIEWHRNKAFERLGRVDTLIMELQSSCWGHVFEQYDYNTNNFLFVQYYCGAGQRTSEESLEYNQLRTQHAGGSISAIDLNGDGLKDLIVGDNGPPYLIAGINSGTLQIAHIDTTTAIAPYPMTAPAYLPSFPATYYEDVTSDGKPDLLVANNTPIAGQDRYSVWMYENIGRADSPAWAPPVIGWLHTTMLDVGTSAHPTLADLNRDGHPDLLLSSESFYTDTGAKARAILLWGTSAGFTLADTNWLDLPRYTLRNPIFAAGDINRNGRTDLIMGTSTGALWHWEEQQAGAANFSLVTQNFGGITAPPFAAPLLYDYDEDGDLDLIIGGRNGRLSLYRQESGGSFSLITDFLGRIEMPDTLSPLLGFVRPALLDIDTDGKPELLVGNLTGFLRLYVPDWTAPTAAWSSWVEIPYHGGKRASPTVWQQNDSILLLVGTIRGGVQAFTVSPGLVMGLPPSADSWAPYQLYREGDSWMLKAWVPLEVRRYDLLGRVMEVLALPEGEHRLMVSQRGIYVLSIRAGMKYFIEKLWIP
ncbi:MAG: VCBS repeat-containing protein [Bacteroidia bacterium]